MEAPNLSRLSKGCTVLIAGRPGTNKIRGLCNLGDRPGGPGLVFFIPGSSGCRGSRECSGRGWWGLGRGERSSSTCYARLGDHRVGCRWRSAPSRGGNAPGAAAPRLTPRASGPRRRSRVTLR